MVLDSCVLICSGCHSYSQKQFALTIVNSHTKYNLFIYRYQNMEHTLVLKQWRDENRILWSISISLEPSSSEQRLHNTCIGGGLG